MSINTKCQVFTPEKYAKKLLDLVGYKKDVINKKVLENSCGDGNILKEIVERIFKEAIHNDYEKKVVIKAIEENIWAYEVDENHILNCKKRLNDLAEKYGYKEIKWNIYKEDFLKQNIENKFDFVIGNPPYITYRELSIKDRIFIKENFITCQKGKFDYCYAFIEASLKALKDSGKLCYLIPGNIFKNQFGEELRKYMLPHLYKIYDYKNQKLFYGKMTSSAIILCQKNVVNNKLIYKSEDEKTQIKLNKNNLVGKWVFEKEEHVKMSNLARFGEYFNASSSVATLLNEVYIISEYTEMNEYIQTKGFYIEKEVLRRAISPRANNYNLEEYIIFPYYYKMGKLEKYTEEIFEKNFPRCVEYLNEFREQLDNRKSDKSAKWFEYGRSQALKHLFQNKLLISTLITGEVKLVNLNKDIIPTSGLYIVPKSNYDLELAQTILTSREFLQYTKKIGVISNGNSYRISPKDINDFMFSVDFLNNN